MSKTIIIPGALASLLMAQLVMWGAKVSISPDIRYVAFVLMVWVLVAAYAFFVMVDVDLWVGLFLLLAAISAQYPILSPLSQETFFCILLGVTWYMVCVQLLNNKRAYNWTLNILCVFAILNVLFLILQHYNIDPTHQPIKGFSATDLPIGLMDNNHNCAAMIALCAIAFRGKWFYALPLIGLGFYMTRAFVGPVSIGAALLVFGIVYLWPKYAIYMICGVVSVLLIYIVFVDQPDIPWRLRAWKIALFEMIPRHWFFGYGLGHWQVKFANPEIIERIIQVSSKQKFGNWMQYAHNEPLQMWFEMGSGFVLLLLGYIATSFKRFHLVAIRPALGVVVLSVCAMVGFPFHNPYLAAVGIFWMAALRVMSCQNCINLPDGSSLNRLSSYRL